MNTLNVKLGQLMLVLSLLTTPSVFAQTLQQSWDEALQIDHNFKSVQQDTVAAALQMKIAKAARTPKLSLQAGYTLLDNAPASKTSFGEMTVGEDRTLSLKAQLSYPLYTNGKISSGIDAANASLQASHINEAAEIQSLKLKVAEAYVGVLRAAKGLKVANSHVDSLAAHARDVENMYKQDMVSRNDLLSAQVALADAKQQAIKAANGLDLAQSSLNRLTGKPMETTIELDEITPEFVDTYMINRHFFSEISLEE